MEKDVAGEPIHVAREIGKRFGRETKVSNRDLKVIFQDPNKSCHDCVLDGSWRFISFFFVKGDITQ